MDTKPLTILLVEDNTAHTELIHRALESSGSKDELRICNNLAEGKRYIQSNSIDLVIADYNLPDGLGTELISPSSSNKRYPLILMTSFGDENIAADAIKSGALDYVVKSPEAFEALPSIIERVMREWRHIAANVAAQQALLLKEREQEEILNSMIDAVISIDEGGAILSFNMAAENLFGYTYSEIIGKNVSQLMPNPFADTHDGYLQRYMQTGEARMLGLGREVEGRHKNKKTFPMRLFIATLPLSSESRQRFIVSCVDLTYIKQQEEQLRRSQKMEALGKLTGGIAHDYNNMLGVIIGYAELLISHTADQPKLLDYANKIHYAGKRGAKLTNKLLSYSRKQSPEATQLDINALLQEQQDMLQKTLTVRIKLKIDLANEIWPIWLDSNDLIDTILNISINAMHAMHDMESGAQLTIQTRNLSLKGPDALSLGLDTDDYVQLSLRDTGSGMNVSTKEKIFDPFFTTKQEKGTGLGLSQVGAFVSRVKGAIKVYSELGTGSTFVLYFPRYNPTDNEKTIEPDVEIVPASGQETLLVVDDEASLREFAAEILSLQGYSILSAENGPEALEILKHNHVDLLFSDVVMPEMNGYQLAAIVKMQYPAVRIQLTSGFNTEDKIPDIDNHLHQNILNKPYSVKMLLEKIKKSLN